MTHYQSTKGSATKGNEGRSVLNYMLRGVSSFAVASALFAGAAAAQDTATSAVEDDTDEIVVTGIRSSLKTSQDIKRNADTFVDSITASDIGSLPDRSVLEAIQRVPGISISRFAAGDDPDHFSVEGSGVVIRGLSYVRSEFNGRDAFSANNGRALGFQDVPPELVGGVDVFKNQTADMIEGGIAGVVNLRTLVPFDKSGRVIALSLDGTYTDMAEEGSPSISALYSNRWDTKHGEIGLMGNVAYSNLKSRSDGFQLAPLYPYNSDLSGAGVAGATDNIAAPAGANIRTQDYDRDRIGVTLAAQWASNDGRSLATAQFIRSDSNNGYVEHVLQSTEDPGSRAGFTALGPITTSGFSTSGLLATRDDRTRVGAGGLFESGVLTSNESSWVTGNNGFSQVGLQQAGFTGVNKDNSITSDYSFNYKFTPNALWKFNFDAQYVDSTKESSNLTAFTAQYFDVALSGIGSDDPTVEYRVPGRTGNTNAVDDPSEVNWTAMMDHFEESDGNELALRADVEHDFDSDGWFKSIRVGARYAEREQVTRYSAYNWGNLAAAWAGGGNQTFADTTDTSTYESFTFENFHRGGILQGANTFLFPSVSLVSDHAAMVAFANSAQFANNGDVWIDAAARDGTTGYYQPGEISDVTEATTALYARVDFGQDDIEGLGGMSISGNYGVRAVTTTLDSRGTSTFNEMDASSSLRGYLPGLAAYLDQPDEAIEVSHDETHVLPSLNVKLGVTDDVIVRFAAANAISRPNVGLLRAYRRTTADARRIVDPGSQTTTGGVLNRLKQSGGNPHLKPVRSFNLDASTEWYFSDVGSLTFSAFYKKLDDVIVKGENSLGIIDFNDGTNTDLLFNGALNNGSGKVKGYEIAYQQFYDFLPEKLGLPEWTGGLGMQANYTYVTHSAIPNGGVSSEVAENSGNDQLDRRFVPTDLENLSKHTYNVVGMFEYDNIEARLAYNWRSDFLLNTTDVITRLPVYNEANGQLDASVKYQITDNFQLGLQGVNLLSEVTKNTVQIDDDGQRSLRSLFENDRRFSVIARMTF